jgi:glycine dehydrogenase subunit 1
MPFIPHTEEDLREMLAALGVDGVEALFDEIPAGLRCPPLNELPPALTELEVSRLMQARARQDGGGLCFLGAGAYDHHVPAAVWEVAGRGEFYSAYTPYQAEASQGTLQVLYEFQSMVAALTALDAANASLYDGASALAEAVLMAARLARGGGGRRVLLPASVHPAYRRVVRSIVRHQGIEVVEVPFSPADGVTDAEALERLAGDGACALVVPQPNYFGLLEEAGELTDWAHHRGLLVIGLVNPLALALLSPPGEWGERGADIACGEGQPLGAPLSSGGPYLGFLACRRSHVRQMPGRIVGRTVDMDGRPGFTLTLQAREQHIRRSKATSNICTNQGLMATAATVHLAILGAEGLRDAASASHRNTADLLARVTALPGVTRVFDRPFFHEVVLRLPAPAASVLRAMAVQNVLAGVPLEGDCPALRDCILVCATEKRLPEDIDLYVQHLDRILRKLAAPACPVRPKMA